MRFSECLLDVDGALSSKRVIAFVAFGAYLLCGIAYYLNHVLPEAYVSGLRDLVIGALAISIPDRFAPTQNKSVTQTSTTIVQADPNPEVPSAPVHSPRPDVPAQM